MHLLERILLYAVTLTSIALVFKAEDPKVSPASGTGPSIQADHSPSEVPSESPRNPAMNEIKLEPIAATELKPSITPSSSTPSVSSSQMQEAIVLKDRRGQPRIEIKLGPNDEPLILLNDQVGQEVLSLKVEESGMGQIRLKHFDRHLEIGPDAKGDLAIALLGQKAEEIKLSLSPEGEARLITKGRTASTLALSSRADGAADIQIHRGTGTGGPLLSVQPNGEAAIGIANNDREYGPVMHLFEDGLGQFSIHGSGSESGPTLIRTPDGTSVIAVRHPNGQPAASMVSSPAGSSILAVTNATGTQQASMRSNKDGKVDIGVTEAEPSEPPPPVKPQPKPPKVPEIELIQHAPSPANAEKIGLPSIAAVD